MDARGQQSEEPVAWPVDDFAELINEQATVVIEGRTVHVRAWRYRVTGESGHVVPVYLLDTDASENQPWDRTITDVLYGGDDRYRLCQEVVLGIGGLRLLRSLGYQIMRHAIALNGAFFNTQRMVAQYLHDAYRLGQPAVMPRHGST